MLACWFNLVETLFSFSNSFRHEPWKLKTFQKKKLATNGFENGFTFKAHSSYFKLSAFNFASWRMTNH